MKNVFYLLIVLCVFSVRGFGQEDSLKEYDYQLTYSDPHDTDMDDRFRGIDSKLKYKDLIGKRLIYDFVDFGYEVIFKSDTLIYWKSLKTAYEETDISKTLHLDPYAVLTAWVELDSSFVSLYSNFEHQKASFFIRSKEGNYEGYSGKIRIK